MFSRGFASHGFSPFYYINGGRASHRPPTQGYRQVVRHGALNAAYVGSNPTSPADGIVLNINFRLINSRQMGVTTKDWFVSEH